jgi:hypothetical protein
MKTQFDLIRKILVGSIYDSVFMIICHYIEDQSKYLTLSQIKEY